MISESVQTYTKLPGEKKLFQVDLSRFLVEREELMDDTFEVHIFEKRTSTLSVSGSQVFSLANVAHIMLTFVTADKNTATYVWDKPEDAQTLTLLLSYGQAVQLKDNEMFVPGTKVWDSTNKVASICVQGGEHGKEYVLFWRFRTTTQRVEEEYAILKVWQDVAMPA